MISNVTPEDFRIFLTGALSDLTKCGVCTKKIFQVTLTKARHYSRQAFQDAFKDIEPITTDTAEEYAYIWVSMSSTNQIIVTGRTRYTTKPIKYGDLFNRYEVSMGKTAWKIYAKLSENDKTLTALITEFEKRINEYSNTAFVIPLQIEKLDEADEIETTIGDRIASVYEVLNPFSQHNGKEPEGNWQHEAWKGNPDVAKQYGIY